MLVGEPKTIKTERDDQYLNYWILGSMHVSLGRMLGAKQCGYKWKGCSRNGCMPAQWHGVTNLGQVSVPR
jgi:hypothetical protein